MPQFWDNATYWRLRAEEVRSLSAQLEDPVAKAATLKIAEHYEQLAIHAAKLADDWKKD